MYLTEVVLRFNDCINNKDVEGLDELMAEDHSFIDGGNNVFSGKENCLHAWEGFFQMFPDYKNVFKQVTEDDDLVKVEGYSQCSDPILAGPALWTAKIKAGRIYEWRVYEDNAANRKLLKLI